MKPIVLNLPADWLAAIDDVRGDLTRTEWIRERIRLSGAMKPYRFERPLGRGKHPRKKSKQSA